MTATKDTASGKRDIGESHSSIGLLGAEEQPLFVEFLTDFSSKHFFDLSSRASLSQNRAALGLVWIQAQWCQVAVAQRERIISDFLSHQLEQAARGLDGKIFSTCVTLDEDDEEAFLEQTKTPPSSLPALALVARVTKDGSSGNATQAFLKYLHPIPSSLLRRIVSANSRDTDMLVVAKHLRSAIYAMEDELAYPIQFTACQEALRIFVGGDRSSVGKSSTCLGLMANLLQSMEPHELAYIKPATQSESVQLIETYCEHHGIRCVPVGPLVYYRGFTRAFLAGQIEESTQELLANCGAAVDRVARGKKVVLVDGVGFPAVGSICGTSNAHVAAACGYPTFDTVNNTIIRRPPGVLLIGGSGVGAAVDAYNLNATYFQHHNVPVMGAIFNKLSIDGFYSLENCREQVTRYFDLQQALHNPPLQQRPFGFVPLFPQLQQGLEAVNQFAKVFQTHVDVSGILLAAQNIKQNFQSSVSQNFGVAASTKTFKAAAHVPQSFNRSKKSRQEIEQGAINAGAAPSA